MRIDIATRASHGAVQNEDFAAAALPVMGRGGVAVVLDGVSAPVAPGMGCSHGTPWFTTSVGGSLLEFAARMDRPFAQCLADAISRTSEQHSGECDLGHPRTPQATLAAVRWDADQLEYLVLGDSEAMVETTAAAAAEVHFLRDIRVEAVRERPDMRRWRAQLDALPIGSDEWKRTTKEYQKFGDAFRNSKEGFFTVAADPSVASEAVNGRFSMTELAGAALLTDGVTQLTDIFGHSDRHEIYQSLRTTSCREVIDKTRALELADESATRYPRRKASDDATAVLIEFSG
ncbi:hypothetical protein ABZ953_07715 [Streptomyces sp. NPDC046465]|uniref:hypothetical protein n=1 Tax=Streptomyces sp. NPDC046465 TaxID=3155810 RepID=UPI0033FED72F